MTSRARRILATACALSVCVLLASGATLRCALREDVAHVRKRVAASSTLYGDLDLPPGAKWMAYATESGVPSLVVASTRGEDPKAMDAGGFWSRPSVSPDGLLVVAESIPAEEGPGSPPSSLRLYDTQTTKGEELAPALPEQELGDAMWSADSRRILYRRASTGSDGTKVATLHVIDVVTRHDEVLATLPTIASPRWLPDGAGIVFFQSPDLWLLDSRTKELRRLTTFPAGSEAYRPVISPDHKTLAVSVTLPGECSRIRLVDLEGGDVRTPFGDECAIVPTWFPSGDELAFFRLGDGIRTLWSRVLGGAERLLGFVDGMVYGQAFAGDGSLLFTGAPSDSPRAIWRTLPDRGSLPEHRQVASTFDPPLEPRWISKPEEVSIPSTNDLQIPLVVFPRTCGDPREPGLAVVWVHHDNDFVAARWVKETQFLTLSGATVFAVNYRGSFGYGPHLRSFKDDARGKVDDVVAAIDYARARPDVDPKKVFLLHVSSGAPTGWGAVIRARGKLRGLIDLVGVPWREVLAAPSDALPSMLWISGATDPMTPERRDIARRLSARASLSYEEYPGGHAPRAAAASVHLLDAMERFIKKSVGIPRCPRGLF